MAASNCTAARFSGLFQVLTDTVASLVSSGFGCLLVVAAAAKLAGGAAVPLG